MLERCLPFAATGRPTTPHVLRP